MWQFFPLALVLSKIGEAANEPPVFVYDADMHLHMSDIQERLFDWMLNVGKISTTILFVVTQQEWAIWLRMFVSSLWGLKASARGGPSRASARARASDARAVFVSLCSQMIMKHPMLRLFERVAIRLGTLIGFSPPPRIAKVEQDADKIMITFNQDAHKKHNETIGSWPIRHYSLLVQFDPLDESEAVDEDDPDGAFTAAEAYTKRIRIESVAEPVYLNLPIGHRFYFRVAAVHDVDPRPNIDVLVRGIFCRKSEKIVVKPAPGSPRDVVVLDKAVGRTASQVAWGAAPGAASYIAEMVNAQSAVLGRAYRLRGRARRF